MRRREFLGVMIRAATTALPPTAHDERASVISHFQPASLTRYDALLGALGAGNAAT
jgi:hypothetical protein